MDCIEVQSCLTEYAERDLMERDHESITRHLQECASCAHQHKTLGAVWETLDKLPVEEPDPFAQRRLFARLDRRSAAWQFSSVLAAASVLIVLGTGWFMRPASLQGTPPVQTITSSTSSAPTDAELAAFGTIDTPVLDDVNALLEEEAQ